MNRLRKAIALLLCLALCLTLTPAAWAEEVEEEALFSWEEEPAYEPAPEAEEPTAPVMIPEVPEAGSGPEEPAFVFEEDPGAEPETPEAPEESAQPEETADAQEADENAATVVINSSNFPDANFRSFVTQYDTNSDGVLSSAELAAVTSIGCAARSIRLLTGIEHFTSLRTLDCSGNSLNSLDVSMLPSLQVLWCTGNQLTALSFGSTLENLDCASNQLTSLSVGHCPGLETLMCPYNKLTSLNLDGNPALSRLTCNGNEITTLDLRKVPKLSDAYNNGLQDTSDPRFTVYSTSSAKMTVDPTVRILASTGTVLTAPTITGQPYDTQAPVGDIATFFVSATGGNLSYQWQYQLPGGTAWNNCTDAGCTTDVLRVTMQEDYVGRKYRCLVFNSLGSATSQAATLTLAQRAKITSQPKALSVTEGDTAVFSVKATGTNIGYRWEYRSADSSTWKICNENTSYKTDTLRFTAKLSDSGKRFRCVIVSDYGQVISNTVELTVFSRPEIITQPQDVSVPAGDTVSLSIETSGSGLSYQWQYLLPGATAWKNNTSAGYNTPSMSFTAKEAYSGRKYRCVVTNSEGGVAISRELTLTVATARPKITVQPKDVTVAVGSKATLSLTAVGAGLRYQWQMLLPGAAAWKNNTSAGYNTASMSFTAADAYSGRKYRCVVSNESGSVTSNVVTLRVTPAITVQPENITIPAEETATLSVKASGSGLSYQWQMLLPGATAWKNNTSTGYNTASMSFTAKEAYSGRKYRCVVSNAGGSVTSSAVTLTVKIAKPKITTQPKDTAVFAGKTATLSVKASGKNLRYQWQMQLPGATTWRNCTSAGCDSAAMSFTMRANYDGRMYRCIVSNESGSVTSHAVSLAIAPKPTITAQPQNIVVPAGTSAVLSIKASGAALKYQWQMLLPGATAWKNCTSTGCKTASMSFTMQKGYAGRKYRCVVSNESGSVTSDTVLLKCGVPIDDTSFPDNNFRNYVSENFDTDGDGILSAAELAAVTEVSMMFTGIQSISGIEYFYALTHLTCSSTKLTSLDVSNNTALTYLDCSGNQLTSLDVSSNTALTVLYCYENQLTYLDVSNNTALTELNCSFNQLAYLDVSSNTALTELECSFNQLTYLDVSGNTALTELSCYCDQLTYLYVSDCPALSDSNIHCYSRVTIVRGACV